MAHSKETIAKIAAGQRKPEVVARKSEAAFKYWDDVRKGLKPKRKKSIGRPSAPIESRFWPKVAIGTKEECWNWKANTTGVPPYGRITGRKKVGEILAHRVSWIIKFGPIPEGMLVLHRCDNTLCVNPSHLFLGTHQDNMDDMISKGRSTRGRKHPGPARGESSASPLNNNDVRHIRRLYSSGTVSQQYIADMYGINQTAVSCIVRRATWKHI